MTIGVAIIGGGIFAREEHLVSQIPLPPQTAGLIRFSLPLKPRRISPSKQSIQGLSSRPKAL